MICCTGEAEEVIGEISVHRKEKPDLLFMVFRLL
jgi:hypothetical protein